MSMKIEVQRNKSDRTVGMQIKEEMECDIERLEPINERRC
jgi:hypothetical protein